MWAREVDGLTLTLQMAGINNRNFLMRDEQTGSYWQQISGRAISGPLAGKSLRLIPSEELTFGVWKSEQSGGTVLRGSARDIAQYESTAMVDMLGEVPEALRAPGLAPREPVIGIELDGEARAWPQALLATGQLVRDVVGSTPVILLTGPDGESVRAFSPHLTPDDDPPEFYRAPVLRDPGDGLMMDDRTGSRWNFQGCAVAGPSAGKCLSRIELVHDFWFAWKRYHPASTLYGWGRENSGGKKR